MERLVIDTGIKEYDINGNGVLRFNPSDPNVYARFMDALPELEKMEQEYEARVKKLPPDADETKASTELLNATRDIDQNIKRTLATVFGEENDFNKLLGGANLMAVAGNGKRIIANLLEALSPIVQAGAKTYATGKVDEIKLNRAQRRAKQR